MTRDPLALAWLALALPLLGFVVNGALALLAPGARRVVSVIGVGVLVLAFAAAVGVFAAVLEGAGEPAIRTLWTWLLVGDLRVDVAVQLDALSAVMLLIVTGVGSLIHVFSVGYMRDDPGYARYFAYLNLFVFFMLVLVLGSSFALMFVGWEGVGLCSYLLIGFWYNEKVNADAGKKAFIVNRIGDTGFLIAMFMIFQHTGSLDFRTVFAAAPEAFSAGSASIVAITLLLFVGCTGKSAQIPLFTWLPDAMQGPTPVSALIHAATMVTAGVYLVARCDILFALAPLSSTVVAGTGALTALFAALIATRQWDIKRVLAYSTISQLGYMFIGVGAGATAAGIFHLATHAFFKALLFLGAGSVIYALHHAFHATHSPEDAQDLRNMGGLRRYMPWTAALMWIATLAIAGVPPLSGFFSKDEILVAAFARATHDPVWYLFWGFGLVAALLTAFYMARMMIYAFHGPARTGEREREHLHEAPVVLTAPLVVLGVLTVAGGALNMPPLFGGNAWLHHWLEPLTGRAAALRSLPHLSHAVEWALVALAVIIAAGGFAAARTLLTPETLLAARVAPPERGFQRVLVKKFYVDEIYDALIVRPLMWLSREVLWKRVDMGLIDGVTVNGVGRLSRWVGVLGSQLQTGQVGVYLAVFVIGVLIVLTAAAR
jgi:NADH-quinone oxidoreductase subunit L